MKTLIFLFLSCPMNVQHPSDCGYVEIYDNMPEVYGNIRQRDLDNHVIVRADGKGEPVVYLNVKQVLTF